ncbi:MAG: methyltransferase domain-containing protein, partial [Ignavibacteriaceae bacterium]
MKLQEDRAHGVTPGLRRDYFNRKAEQQAAFALPYLKPGMNLLDIGCGPGTITVGLADWVKPGSVTGIDHDKTNVEAAEKLAAEKNTTNAFFRKADALSLPFKDNLFDAAFENNLFVHLSNNAVDSAKEIYRVLKVGGFFAARDADADSVVWGNQNEPLKEFDKIFYLWQQN